MYRHPIASCDSGGLRGQAGGGGEGSSRHLEPGVD